MDVVHSPFRYACGCGTTFICKKYLKTHLRRARRSDNPTTHFPNGRSRVTVGEMTRRCRQWNDDDTVTILEEVEVELDEGEC